MTAAQDGIKYLGMTQNIMCEVEDYLQDTWVMAKAENMLHKFFNKLKMTNDKYKTQFK